MIPLRTYTLAIGLLLICALVSGCFERPSHGVALVEVARSDRQWTGVAVSKTGRLFVNWPRWSDDVSVSVGEIMPDGRVVPFPDKAWNSPVPNTPASKRFVCVQSVYVDDQDALWILDPANPKFAGVVPSGPKLLKVNLATNKVERVFAFDATIAPKDSYLNDIRVDTARQVAYLTESGMGAIIVLDLATGKARRLLDNHPSTTSEDIVLTIEGKPWLPRGPKDRPRVHADGLALNADRTTLYYQALTARHLHRIETRFLRDESLSDEKLAAKVQTLSATGASDAIMFGPRGYLYLSAIEDDAVRRYTPEGKVETVVKHPKLAWPDSFAIGADGVIYVTTSQIHRAANPGEPYMIFKFTPPD